jgi:hypothetical protein
VKFAPQSFFGARNDQNTADILQIHKLITEEEGMVVDGGYAGILGKNVIHKRRGKLSSDDIIWNNKIEAVRVVVENQFKSIKNWDICGKQFRCKASRTRTLEDTCLEHQY